MSSARIGYAKVAEWMARDIDDETLIYRRFVELSARCALYLQSELLDLEYQLQKLDEEDADQRDDLDWVDVICTWEEMKRLVDPVGSNNSESIPEQIEAEQGFEAKAKTRMDLVRRIHLKLKEYHETLILQSEIAKLERPSNRVLKAFKLWFTKPPKLGGKAQDLLQTPQDFIALNVSHEKDYMSEYLRQHWPVKKENMGDGICIGRYEERSISIAVALISIMIAASLLIGSIVGLYFVQNDVAKLGLITLFTALFALSVGVMTNARRAEIFAGTAAYAAVLVVFVSGDLASSPKS